MAALTPLPVPPPPDTEPKPTAPRLANFPVSAGQYDRLGDVFRREVWDDGGQIVWCPSVPGRNVTVVTDDIRPLIRRGLAELSDVAYEHGRRQVRLTESGEAALRARQVTRW